MKVVGHSPKPFKGSSGPPPPALEIRYGPQGFAAEIESKYSREEARGWSLLLGVPVSGLRL